MPELAELSDSDDDFLDELWSGDEMTTVETSRTKLDAKDATPQSTRRLIKPDLSLIVNNDYEDVDLPPSPCVERILLNFEDECEKPKGNWKKTVALDLAMQEAGKPERRHSITVCESPVTTQPSNGASNTLSSSMECLSLTLEEVVHIRNVLTKADLESLLVDKNLYDEVSKGKVCFICKKTKFSFFGSWGQKCRLCQRNVCEKCCAKMRIPIEHFSSIPVFTLSPGSTSSIEEEPNKSLWKLPDVSSFLTRRMSVGSAPSSPIMSRKRDHSMNSPNSTNSSPAMSPLAVNGSTPKRRPLLRSRTLNRADSVRRDKLCGELMTVCKECRAMVRHTIVANRRSMHAQQRKMMAAANGSLINGKSSSPSSSSQQLPPSRDLHLNLAPIY